MPIKSDSEIIPKRIFVFDHDRLFCSSMLAVLELNGYNVIISSDPIDAIKQIAKDIPDLIVLNCDKGNIENSLFYQGLAERLSALFVPVLLTTIDYQPMFTTKYKRYFYQASILIKPFDPTILINSINEHFIRRFN